MILRKINESEAILEPYFDGGDSDNRYLTEKGSALAHYDVKVSNPALVRVQQGWCAISVRFDGSGSEGEWAELRRECRLEVSEYDALRLFAAIPKTVGFEILLKENGAWRTGAAFQGDDTTEEHDAPLESTVLEGFGYRITLPENRPAVVDLRWVGLTDRKREEASVQNMKGRYDPEWEDYMKPEGDFVPRVGIWFGPEEADALRKKVHGPLLGKYYEALLKKAESWLDFDPESQIGTYIANSDRRWVRTRDMKLKSTAEAMELLAFTGLMEKREDLSRMAVRMALSAANCQFWNESFMGSLAGCSWHHRSFTEEQYCRGCASVLDWAGGFLTPWGRTCILDAIAMKGLPRLESDYRRMEYIRHMNQGIVFNWGRLMGLLAMESAFPRYDIRIEESERELLEMISNYVLPDGGTLEGPGYWNYTFSQALPQLYLYARWHGRSSEGDVPENIRKTGEHILALLSVRGSGDETFSVNDAHGGKILPTILAAYARLTGKEIYGQLLATAFAEGGLEPKVEMFILLPENIPEPKPVRHLGLAVLPDLGQTRLVREDPTLGDVCVFYSGGPAYFGHFHQDKGAILLETRDESFLIDRGVTNYSHPETGTCGLASYHNLACPDKPDGSLARQVAQNEGETGAVLVSSRIGEDGVWRMEGDTTKAWAPGIVKRSIRRVTSPNPREYLVEDEIELCEEMPVSFYLNTQMDAETGPDGAVFLGKKARLEIRPEDWIPESVCFEEKGVDGHEKPVNRLRMVHPAAKVHRFRTRLTLVPNE